MSILSNAIKSQLRRNGYELCKLYDSEKTAVPEHKRFTFREAQCYRALTTQGQLSIEEARLLGEVVRDSDPVRPIIEIGTLFGFSTMVITLFKARTQRLITVDNYSWNPLGMSSTAHFAATSARLAEAVRSQNVDQVQMDKDLFYKTYAGPPPAVFFCDADHAYDATKADILWARSVGASFICGDDYDLVHERGTARAVDELGGPRRLAGGLFVM